MCVRMYVLHPHTHSLTHSLTHTLSLSLTHTHSHSHTHTHTHTIRWLGNVRTVRVLAFPFAMLSNMMEDQFPLPKLERLYTRCVIYPFIYIHTHKTHLHAHTHTRIHSTYAHTYNTLSHVMHPQYIHTGTHTRYIHTHTIHTHNTHTRRISQYTSYTYIYIVEYNND